MATATETSYEVRACDAEHPHNEHAWAAMVPRTAGGFEFVTVVCPGLKEWR